MQEIEITAAAAAASAASVRAALAPAASSGIAVLSPVLFTLVTVQHLELTPGMCHTGSAVAKGSGRWGSECRQTLPFISITSVLSVGAGLGGKGLYLKKRKKNSPLPYRQYRLYTVTNSNLTIN